MTDPAGGTGGGTHPPTAWRAHDCAVPLTADDRAMAVRLLLVLRPGLTAKEAASFLDDACATGYTVTFLRDTGGETVALAGYRILATSRGRVLFLEDLVVNPAHRRGGAASALLTHVVAAARAAGCARIELDTGITNTSAQAFYERAGLSRVAVHYSLTV